MKPSTSLLFYEISNNNYQIIITLHINLNFHDIIKTLRHTLVVYERMKGNCTCKYSPFSFTLQY